MPMPNTKELQEELKKDKTETPRTIGVVKVPPTPTQFDTKILDLENKQNVLEKSIESVRHTNAFVLVILLVGFITMFTAFFTMLILAYNSGATTQTEFIKSTQQILDFIKK